MRTRQITRSLFSFVIFTLLLAPNTLRAQENPLRDAILPQECETACWVGIQPGITTQAELEAILVSNNITYWVNGGFETLPDYVYHVGWNENDNSLLPYSAPFGTLTIVVRENIVIAIQSQLDENTSMSTILADIGDSPTAIVYAGYSPLVIYEEYELALTIETRLSSTFFAESVILMEPGISRFLYLDFGDPAISDLQPCTEPVELCSIPTHSHPVLSSYILVNRDTGTDIVMLTDNITIDPGTLGTSNLTIRANTNPENVGSVVFDLNGTPAVQADNSVPYELTNWTPTLGQYVLTATPYSGVGGTGTAGTPLTIHFTVVNPIVCSDTVPDTPALLSAITSANSTPEPVTVCLEAGTYTLDAPITSEITLVGLGAGAEISGTLQVSGAGRLTLRNVSVSP